MAATMSQSQGPLRSITTLTEGSASQASSSQSRSLSVNVPRSFSSTFPPQATNTKSPEFLKNLSKFKRSQSSIATSPSFYSLSGSFLSSSADSRFDSSKFLKAPVTSATPRTFPPIRGLSSNGSPEVKLAQCPPTLDNKGSVKSEGSPDGLSFLAGLAMKKSEGSRNSAEVDEKGSNSSGSRRASLDRPRKPPHLSLAVSNTPAMQRAHQIAAQRRAQSVPPADGTNNVRQSSNSAMDQLRQQLPSMVGPDRRRHPTQLRAMSSPVERRPPAQMEAGLLAPMRSGHARSNSHNLPSIRSITASPPQARMASLPPHARDAAHPYAQAHRRDPRQPQQVDKRTEHQDQRLAAYQAQQQMLRHQQNQHIAQVRHQHEQRIKIEQEKKAKATEDAKPAPQPVQKTNLIYSKAHVKMVLRNVCPVESCNGPMRRLELPRTKSELVRCDDCSRTYWKHDDKVPLALECCPIYGCAGKCVVYEDDTIGTLHGCTQCRLVYQHIPPNRRKTY